MSVVFLCAALRKLEAQRRDVEGKFQRAGCRDFSQNQRSLRPDVFRSPYLDTYEGVTVKKNLITDVTVTVNKQSDHWTLVHHRFVGPGGQTLETGGETQTSNQHQGGDPGASERGGRTAEEIHGGVLSPLSLLCPLSPMSPPLLSFYSSNRVVSKWKNPFSIFGHF